MRTGSATAHANIALVKYWGKRDEDLILPLSPSISLTLDALSTTTEFVPVEDLSIREIHLDGKIVKSSRIERYLDRLLRIFDISTGYIIHTRNSFPESAGLASSSSGFCALAGAFASAAELNLRPEEISRIARLGSGSACRSVYPGFAEWVPGDDLTSISHPIQSPLTDRIAIVCCMVSRDRKEISSRSGMKQAQTSPSYRDFIRRCFDDFDEIKRAVIAGDIEKVGNIAEGNALAMNMVNQTAVPPLNYLKPKTRAILDQVRVMRKEGLPCWFTNDAGPNAFIITLKDAEKSIVERLKKTLDAADIVTAESGPGLEVVDA